HSWDGALAWAKALSQLLLPAQRGLKQGQGLFPSLPDTAPGAVPALWFPWHGDGWTLALWVLGCAQYRRCSVLL
ncbi:unnamed protein product, partial [Bubo scandiacus]